MAPLALTVVIAAVGYVVSSNTRDDAPGGSSPQSEGDGKASTNGKTSTGARTGTTPSQPRRYTVKAGDTLGTIAEQTGVPVTELVELNPELDPQNLTVGDRIRIRR